MISNVNATTAFGHKKPTKSFKSMMYQIYKKVIRSNKYQFESYNTIQLTTQIHGSDISAFAHFRNNKYVGLVMERGNENLKDIFKQIALEKYNKKNALRQAQTSKKIYIA